jgi:hypothetical protein
VVESRLTHEDDKLSSVVAAGERLNTPECTIDESQSHMSRNNSIDSEIKELQEKNLALTTTVARLEQLIKTIQCNSTTNKAIFKDTLDAMAMLALDRSANDQAITELRSIIIPTMRQEWVDKFDSLRDNIDSGFSNMRTMFKQMPRWKAAPTV